MHLNKRYTLAFLIMAVCCLGACHGTVKEYTVVREKARAVGPVESDMISVMVPLLDAQGNLVQNATVVQQNGRPVFARLLETKGNTPVQTVNQGSVSQQNTSQLSPVTGQPIGVSSAAPQQSQAGNSEMMIDVSVQQAGQIPQQAKAIPGQSGYTGQVPFPLSAGQAPEAAPVKQSQVQAQIGMNPTPMQSNIVASYENCPYIVVLQHPVERTLVKCLLCDKVCIARFEQNGFVQVRYLPQSSGAVQTAPSDYPGGKWTSSENIPRW